MLTEDGGRITVINGELGGATSPARAYTPLVGAEIALRPGGRLRLPLRPDFEHAVLALSDPVEVDGTALTTGSLLHLGEGRREVLLSAESASRALLIGGAPFDEELVMWWNFVARTHEEVVEARRDWEAERTGPSPDRFGAVPGYDGAALPAPEPPRARLRARPRAGTWSAEAAHRARSDQTTSPSTTAEVGDRPTARATALDRRCPARMCAVSSPTPCSCSQPAMARAASCA
ncbi:hypothetical protein GCM10020366_70400 [Saccharopolyspora gregorii]|uniref:Pirin C-terminal domain-containing protein n=1 Tax=Saccharopolyspora gregorii TaxID=33914 RepID=A0ABP6S2Q8_9PSEU